MYRIELAPGEVTVFRTIEELATGVRNGLITSKARIYHSASEKWLPIGFHPHYKRALGIASGRAADRPASKVAERPRNEPLTFLSVPLASGTPQLSPPSSGATPPTAQSPEPVPPKDKTPVATPAPTIEASMPTIEASMPTIEAPAIEAPVIEASAVEASAVEAPVIEAPVIEAPVIEAPVIEAPVIEAPVIEAPMTEASVITAPPTTLVLPWAKAPDEPTPIAHAPATFAGSAEITGVIEEGPALQAADDESVDGLHPALPPVSSSPVLELPRITYPEFTPLEEPTAARSNTSGRRRALHLAGAVVLLALGGYASTALLSLGRSDDRFVAASTLTERPAGSLAPRPSPAQSSAATAAATPPSVPTPTSTAAAAPTSKPAAPSAPKAGDAPAVKVAIAPVSNPGAASTSRPGAPAPSASPAPQAPLPPVSSGFARALDPRAIVSAPAQLAAPKPSDPAADSTLAAPPPTINTKVAAPVLPGSDALTPATRQKSDSAMKKILRAVSGGKGTPPSR
jgi:hypothetical protein